MAILNTNEYDISYFDGQLSTLTHNAGFTKYKRWARNSSEFWKDIAIHLNNANVVVGKKTLELACAKGYIVKDLRDMGAEAWGMDTSAYAIGEAEPEAVPYLIQGDVRTDLTQFSNNEFDFVYSIRLFECLRDEEIEPLIAEMKRISRKQAHIITLMPNATYYNVKTLQEWAAYPFPKNTILAEYNKLDNFITK